MRAETHEKPRKLRHGYTTGACATVTSLAAASLLLNGKTVRQMQISLPRGQTVTFALERQQLLEDGRAESATIKDAGDDPDVTHLATIISRVRLIPEPGVRFMAGEGVGTVTRSGLPIPAGEPAINPVPRQMINHHLQELANERSYQGGFEVEVSVEDGAALALKTMNPRLGIVGGLSILGTTGIVRPFSCAAYIASIHQALDVASSNGCWHVAACTGSNSERGIQFQLELEEMALIDMGDFVGAVLKHLRNSDIKRLSIAGGFGKLSKLAEEHLDLHSRTSSINLDFIATAAGQAGASLALQDNIRQANSSLHALELCNTQNIPVADQICRAAQQFAIGVNRHNVTIDVWAFDRNGSLIGKAL